jgi:hypothetical protein
MHPWAPAHRARSSLRAATHLPSAGQLHRPCASAFRAAPSRAAAPYASPNDEGELPIFDGSASGRARASPCAAVLSERRAQTARSARSPTCLHSRSHGRPSAWPVWACQAEAFLLVFIRAHAAQEHQLLYGLPPEAREVSPCSSSRDGRKPIMPESRISPTLDPGPQAGLRGPLRHRPPDALVLTRWVPAVTLTRGVFG